VLSTALKKAFFLTGNFTKATVTTPVHLIYGWDGDKIVSMYRYFDPSQLKVEIGASQKK